MRRLIPLAAATLAVAVPLAGCSKDNPAPAASGTGAATADTSATLAEAISSAPDLTLVSKALSNSGLADVFDGPGAYTVLAPDDEAFGKLGDGSKALDDPANRAELVAVLRGHILPGSVTLDSIKQAIAQKKGPVKMRTVGDGTVTFASSGDTVTVTGDDGSEAKIDGSPAIASNGVVLPLDGFVKTPPKPAA